MANSFKLPLWGAYSKKYMGLSRIIDSLSDMGARFDFTIHPTLWNSSTPVPNVTVPSNYHLWQCNEDFSYYAYRYELLWKDQVYADVSFSKINDESYLARICINNNTDLKQNAVINFFSALEFPSAQDIELDLPEKSRVINAVDYEEFEYKKHRPWDEQNPDGLFKGTFRDMFFYKRNGLGDRNSNKHVHFYDFKTFGEEAGDRVSYKISSEGFESPCFAIRYRTTTDENAEFMAGGKVYEFEKSDELVVKYFDFTENPEFISLGKGGVELDFIAVVEKGEKVSAHMKKHSIIPEIDVKKLEKGFKTTLKYGYDDCNFTILTFNDNTRHRVLETGALEDALINRLSNGDVTYDDLTEPYSKVFLRRNSVPGFFENTLIKSIFIEPHSSHTEFAVIAKGDAQPLTPEEYEYIYFKAKGGAGDVEYNRCGEEYSLSTNILKATLLTNIVYPVYRFGEYVAHYTPGKRWDSFYTWDSGFIGMGLLETSKEISRYVLDMYLKTTKNNDYCFLLHGSLVPTQFEQYLELLKRYNDKSELNYLYPKMKHYYEFLLGRANGSTCAKFGNGLLTTYDYWYSSSGMDDYPAQLEMIKNKAEEYSCPCISTSQAIRAAKILKMAATYLGYDEDVKVYDADIKRSGDALNELAWDEESGYYGYTLYDKEKPYIMKTADGENWNKGFDGIYPLIAGVAGDERKKRLIDHLKNPKEMFSKSGISAVDMSASYYMNDGYWNGNVWMSHQWFVYKAMLDNGETEFAYEIAHRALDIWKRETDFSYFTYECFGIETQRGGWFHNFGGLSAPICIWANAYYKPQTVTSGFDVWTDYQKTDEKSAEIKFKFFGNSEKYSIIVTLKEDETYQAFLNGEPVSFNQRNSGCLEFTFSGEVKEGVLKIV
ncbi:MAG: hypothetical protein IJ731_02235 [Eubacterium sp.]|nr:hypothetical protein [Eubacterium sp.]